MPLCVNRTFFTACFLTSATAGGVNPCAAAPAAGAGCFQQISGRVVELNNNSVRVCAYTHSVNVLISAHRKYLQGHRFDLLSCLYVRSCGEVTVDLKFPGLIPVFRLPGRKSQVPASVQHHHLRNVPTEETDRCTDHPITSSFGS